MRKRVKLQGQVVYKDHWGRGRQATAVSSSLLKGPVCFASAFNRDGRDEHGRVGRPNKGITRGESWHFREQTEPFAVHSSLVIGLIEIETSYCTWVFFIMGVFSPQ